VWNSNLRPPLFHPLYRGCGSVPGCMAVAALVTHRDGESRTRFVSAIRRLWYRFSTRHATARRFCALSRMPSRILRMLRKKVPPRRYPLKLPFSYVARQGKEQVYSGFGETIEISSLYIGVWPLPLRSSGVTELALSIQWPATLPDGTRLQLVIQSLPIGPHGQVTELCILNHEFRTARRCANGLSAPLNIPKSHAQTESDHADKLPTVLTAAFGA